VGIHRIEANELARIDQFQKENPGAVFDWVYEQNSYGMRQSYDVLEQVDVCFYGCSVTWGTGVSQQDVWAHQVAANMGWTYNNFALPGLGQEECVNLFMASSRLVGMKSAVFLFPGERRLQQAFERQNQVGYEYQGIVSADTLSERRDVVRFHKDWFTLPHEFFYERMIRNLEIINHVAESRGIRVYVGSWSCNDGVFDDVRDPHVTYLTQLPPKDNKGRDGQHQGCEWHRTTAERVCQIIRSKQHEQ
jgi:hypothetical protein